MELENIAKKVRVCTLCPLHNSRKNAVPGEGPDTVKLMFIGEAPGAEEDKLGRPFVGRAGKVFDQNLQKAGIDRSRVFVTSVVKCRPPENRTPHQNEIQTCINHYLYQQIECLDPKVICLLGGVAIKTMLGVDKVEDARGKVKRENRSYYATYHPAGAGRNPAWERAFYDDLCAIRNMLE